MDNPIDWTKFTRRIYINRPMQEVYDACTIPAKIEQWFLEKADYFSDGNAKPNEEHYRKGDHYEWKWHNWDFIEKGEVLEVNGKDFVRFQFADGTVSVYLEEENNSTHLRLVQDGIAADEKSKFKIFCGCSVGWSFWLTNLKAWMEHGITLHETRPLKHDGFEMVNC